MTTDVVLIEVDDGLEVFGAVEDIELHTQVDSTITVSVGGGPGDVMGPVGAVDGSPAVFDGVSGKTIKQVTYPTFKTSLALVKADVGLGNVDNTSDAGKPVSTAQQTALDLKANLASPTFTGTVVLPAKTVTLAMQADMATASLVYRKTAGAGAPEVNTLAQVKTDLALAKADVGLGNVDNTSDANKPVSTAQQTALNLKANLASPTFTGTVAGVTASMVGLGNVDNTSDVNKPVSTAQATADALALPKTGGTLSGQVTAAVGTTVIAPLVLRSGTNLTTAAAGAWEFDGTVSYFTAAASSRQVGLSFQFMRLTAAYTLTSQTAAQKLFNTPANGTVTLQANTTYRFRCKFTLTSMSGTSGSFGFAFGGTATLTRQAWWAEAQKTTALATAGTGQTTYNTAANVALVTASTATNGLVEVEGVLTVGTGGTLIPEVSLGIAAAAVVGVESFFEIWAEGSDIVTNVGNMS